MNGPQTVLKGAELVLSTVSGDGVPDMVYAARCRSCQEFSELGQDEVRLAAVWAVEHTRAHLGHRDYVMTTRTRWRVDHLPETPAPPTSDGLTGTVPAPGPTEAGGDEPPQPKRHAKPRPSVHWPGALAVKNASAGARSWIARFAGPLFIAMISGALAFVLYAALIQGVTSHG